MSRPKGSKNKDIKLPKSAEKLEEAEQMKKNEIEANKTIESNESEKLKVFKKTANELSKQFGKSIVHVASEEEDKERIPTGIEAIDKLITGFPAGAFSIIWGNKGSTKTTTTYHLISQAQKLGKTCLYLDLEHSYDNEWAKRCGIDIDKLLLANDFTHAEQALDIAIKLCNEKAIDVVVLDSVQALSPRGENQEKSGQEKSTEDDTMALLARKLSLFFRVSSNGVYKGKVTFILIGQARINLGTFIKLETLSGGKALAHWATLIIKVYEAGKADAPQYKFKVKEKNKSFVIGKQICYCLEKKKISNCAPERTEVRQDFYNEFGFRKPSNEEIENLYKDWIDMEKSDGE